MRSLLLACLLVAPVAAKPGVSARLDGQYHLHLTVKNNAPRPLGYPPFKNTIPQGWHIEVKDRQGEAWTQVNAPASVQAFHPSHLILVDPGKSASQTVDVGAFENWQGKKVARTPGQYTLLWWYSPTPIPFYPRRLDFAWKSYQKDHLLLPAVPGGSIPFQVPARK